MATPSLLRVLLPLLPAIFLCFTASPQSRSSLTDARQDKFCTPTLRLIEEKPPEVLFGVHIDEAGDVYFTLNSPELFNQLFTGPQDGLTADIILKDQYACSQGAIPSEQRVPKGTLLTPVYLPELRKRMDKGDPRLVNIKLGSVPAQWKTRTKDLEGNLVILKNGVICYYTKFVDIDRRLWGLLPMGLHTDTVISTEKLLDTSSADLLRYTRKLQFTVPFAKNKAVYNKADLKPLYDSLHLTDYRIRKVDIRAYSSVEGAEHINRQLQEERSASMVRALQQYQSPSIQKQVLAAENWIEFLQDIQGTPYADWASLPREAIKAKLKDKAVAEKLEPLLGRHRKAIVTIYLDKKSGLENAPADNLPAQFKEALAQRKLYKASLLQQEVFERIADNRLPAEFANKLEIPQEKFYSLLLSDRETYKYQLGLTGEDEALENFKTLLKLDTASGRIRYNICALSFAFWQYDTTFLDQEVFLQDIQALPRYGITPALVQRMLINYHIVHCEHSMYRADYTAKDNSLFYIYSHYTDLKMSDEEVLSTAKYLCHYARCDVAEKLVAKRVGSIDVNEDLLFYYLNLHLFNADANFKQQYRKEINNAINLNRARFCRFFYSLNNGGASFQLLENPSLREVYCEYCEPVKGK